MSRFLPALILALLLAGCARVPPRVPLEANLPPLPERWAAGGAPSGAVEAWWWKSFGDPVLDRLVLEVLENNRDLAAAAARLEAAAAEARIAGADRYPTLGAGFTQNRRRQNFIGFPIPGAESRVLSTTFTTRGISLDTSWEADLWGRLRRGESAALARVQAVESDRQAAEHSLAAQTTRAYYALTEAAGQVSLAQEVVESYRRSVEVVRVRFESGLRPSLDLRLSLSNLRAAEARLQQRRELLERQKRQLEIVLGRYPEGSVAGAAALPDLPPSPPAGLPAEMIARRPDLRAAERRVAAANAGVEQSRAALYPRLSLTGSSGTATRELKDLLNGDFGVWSLGSSLLQPIFQGGRLRAAVDQSEARSREAAATFASTALRALAEVETAMAAEGILALQERDLGRAAAEAAEALTLAETRYGSGLEGIVTVLEAQRRVLDARAQLLSVRRQRIDARIDLHLALGGGFPEPGSPAGADTEKTGEAGTEGSAS